MSINVKKRVFGGDFPLDLKRRLEARQTLAEGTADFGDEIESQYKQYIDSSKETFKISDLLDSDTNGALDMGSRTPWARMWAALTIEEESVEREEIKGDGMLVEEEYNKRINSEKVTAEGARTYYTADVGPLDRRKILKWTVKPVAKVLHQVGNHITNQFMSSSPTSMQFNQTFTNSNVGAGGIPGMVYTDKQKALVKRVSTQEFDTNKNEFMKPPAEIRSVTTSTQGSLGLLKETEVQFTVYNFHDFDKIYSQYFMKPGARIFVDYGWSTSDLYDPANLVFSANKKQAGLIDNEDLENALFGEDGIVPSAAGDMDVICGYLTSYEAAFLDNGTFDCTITLSSCNYAVMDRDFADGEMNRKFKIAAALDAHVTNIAAKILTENSVQDKSQAAPFLLTSNWQSNYNDVRKYTAYSHRWAYWYLSGAVEAIKANSGGDELKLTDYQSVQEMTWKAVQSGVYWVPTGSPGANLPGYSGGDRTIEFAEISNGKNLFITWGFFEDHILNKEFGIGASEDNILKGGKFESRIDSSNTYVTWNEDLWKYQKESGVARTSKSFLYPHDWGGYSTYDEDDTEYSLTYNICTGKCPRDKLSILEQQDVPASTFGLNDYKPKTEMAWKEALYKVHKGIADGDGGILGVKCADGSVGDLCDYDKALGRVPLREIYINLDMIKDAITNSYSANEFMKEIADKIRQDSKEMIDLQMTSPDISDSTVAFVDANHLAYENATDNTFFMDNLFTFKPRSKNSIVKEMDLSFQTPGKAVQNQIVIQHSSNAIQYTLDKEIDSLLALKHISQDPQENENEYFEAPEHVVRYGFSYFPETGNYAARRLAHDKNQYQGSIGAPMRDNLTPDLFTKPTNSYLQQKKVNNPGSAGSLGSSWGGTFRDQSKIGVDDIEVGDEYVGGVLFEQIKGAPQDTQQMEALWSGINIAKDDADYHLSRAKGRMMANLASVVPIDLTLKIYGTATIWPGDVFKIDYLPNRMRNTVFFMVKSIVQNISPSGWDTEITAAMRVKYHAGKVWDPIGATDPVQERQERLQENNPNNNRIKQNVRNLNNGTVIVQEPKTLLSNEPTVGVEPESIKKWIHPEMFTDSANKKCDINDVFEYGVPAVDILDKLGISHDWKVWVVKSRKIFQNSDPNAERWGMMQKKGKTWSFGGGRFPWMRNERSTYMPPIRPDWPGRGIYDMQHISAIGRCTSDDIKQSDGWKCFQWFDKAFIPRWCHTPKEHEYNIQGGYAYPGYCAGKDAVDGFTTCKDAALKAGIACPRAWYWLDRWSGGCVQGIFGEHAAGIHCDYRHAGLSRFAAHYGCQNHYEFNSFSDKFFWGDHADAYVNERDWDDKTKFYYGCVGPSHDGPFPDEGRDPDTARMIGGEKRPDWYGGMAGWFVFPTVILPDTRYLIMSHKQDRNKTVCVNIGLEEHFWGALEYSEIVKIMLYWMQTYGGPAPEIYPKSIEQQVNENPHIGGPDQPMPIDPGTQVW